jgi:hypothetical protein
MASDRKTIIRRWMLEIVSDGGIERFNHLHLGDIDARWKDPTSWVSAGLTAYGLALEMQRELDLDVTIALSFGLVDRNIPISPTTKSAGCAPSMNENLILAGS